jgi:hypothetical protein
MIINQNSTLNGKERSHFLVWPVFDQGLWEEGISRYIGPGPREPRRCPIILIFTLVRAEFIELLFVPDWKKIKWSPLFWAKLYCESF